MPTAGEAAARARRPRQQPKPPFPAHQQPNASFRAPDGSWRPLGALVVDYDRTLTDGALRPMPGSLAALAGLRRAGVPTVLCTGRPRAGLAPGVVEAFACTVLEGGALVEPGEAQTLAPRDGASGAGGIGASGAGGLRTTAARWMDAVEQWCASRGIAVERRQASFSLAQADAARFAACPLPGLVAHRNHDRLDVTRGCDKGTALRALRAQGVGRGGLVVGIADGANDRPMLAACDVGLAVQGADASLAAVAHEVLPWPGGQAVEFFIRQRVRFGSP